MNSQTRMCLAICLSTLWSGCESARPGSSSSDWALRKNATPLSMFGICKDDVPGKCIPFTPQPTEYSYENALILAHFSNFAYLKIEQIEAELKKLDLGLYDYQLIEDIAFFAVVIRGTLVVVFRGTVATSLKNLAVDFNIMFDQGSVDVQAHAGFSGAVKKIQGSLDELARRHAAEFPGGAVWLSGHSLGGGVATVAAFYLKRKKSAVNLQGLYTFGCPRVLSKQEAIRAADIIPRLARICHGADPICEVPSQIRFTHIDAIVHYDGQCRRSTLDRSAFKKILQAVHPKFLIDPLHDHALARYTNCIHSEVFK